MKKIVKSKTTRKKPLLKKTTHEDNLLNKNELKPSKNNPRNPLKDDPPMNR